MLHIGCHLSSSKGFLAMGRQALELGADVPSCLAAKAVQVSGIGEILTPAPELPVLFLVLVNPNRPVFTPAVFKAREPVFSAPAPFTEKMTDFDVFIRALAARRNDLSDAACQIEPSVFEVLQALQADPLCRQRRDLFRDFCHARRRIIMLSTNTQKSPGLVDFKYADLIKSACRNTVTYV